MKKRYIALIILIAVAIAFTLYFYDYYHTTDTGTHYSNVTVKNTTNGILLDGPGCETALIFYPGAKIEYTSYLALLSEISSQGVDCYLVEMPLNLAVFGADRADPIIENTNYSHYIISGHSVGGSMAAKYASNNDKIEGLVLLAAYPSDEVKIPTLSVYGSKDKILNQKTYNDSKKLINNTIEEHIISGGNHAQFGNYGKQKDDGTASITSSVQQNETAHIIVNFINRIK